MERRKVYVVDDEEPIRRSTSLLLKVAGFDAQAFEAGTALLDAVHKLAPGPILLDIRMPDLDGIEVQRALRERQAVHPVVIMTGHGDLQAAISALENGAIAFVEKPFSKTRLLEMLDLAFLKLEDSEGFAGRSAAARERIEALGGIEQAVLAELTRGRSTDDIRTELGLSPGEVEVRRARIFEQLGVDSLTGALNVAFVSRLSRG